MPGLFDPFVVRGVTLRNRIGLSPMCQYSSVEGLAGDWHLVHLGSRAIGGFGLVMVEATAVEARGRISPSDMGLWRDEQADALAGLARFIAAQGAVPGLQLAHAGRKASHARPWEGGQRLTEAEGGWRPIAPSPLPFHPGEPAPVEMSTTEIAAVLAAFRAAALRARHAGFGWLELHAAHGYLCHSFCSPLSNQRTDEYGGSFSNRVRFTLEALEAIRSVWPDRLPVSVRISCSDWVPGGWSVADSVALAWRLKQLGADVIDCSSGGSVPDARVPVAPGYQVPFAEELRREAQVATAAVGLITDPVQADEIVRQGRADLVLLGREALRDPYWPSRAARVLQQLDRLRVPPQYLRGWPRS